MNTLYPNPETSKESYFIFLDIDGTLVDLKYGKRVMGPLFSFGENTVLNPESIEALNLLLASLEEKYDTSLVITSGRRNFLKSCVKHLYNQGLQYDKSITCTPFVSGRRGQKIIDHMFTKSKPKHPQLKKVIDFILRKYADGGYKNYVVIEDQVSKIRYEIPPKRRIITNAKKQSLTIEQVEKYLNKNNIPIVENQSLQEKQ